MKSLKCLRALLPLLVLGGGCAIEKSENPLSPTLAGPIPGVEISAPKPLEPAAGAAIPGNRQPVTLLLENASSNGPRPLTYMFEIATDAGFTNKVFARDSIQPGDGGRTSLKLPDALSQGRSYYWRAKAEDGANSGPYSAAVNFDLYTPVAFDKPVLISPVNNERTTTARPDFRFTNAPRVGSPGPISYVIEIGTTDSFSNKLVAWQFGEQPNVTTFAAASELPANLQLFWHTRAIEATALGPWSDTQVFRTPVPVVVLPPPPPDVPIGGACSAQRTHLAVVQCRRQQFGHMSPDVLNVFLRSVARDLTNGNFSGAPYGILPKPGGNNCLGYSCDIVCAANGDLFDVLGDSEGSQDPLWLPKGNQLPCEFQR